MKTPLVVSLVVATLATSLVSAAMQARGPSGERAASASLEHESGDITISYNTLYYGQEAMNNLLSGKPENRDWANRMLKSKVRGSLETEFALEVGDEELAEGKHSFALEAIDAETFGIRFGDGELIEMDGDESPWMFTNLSAVLASDGAKNVRLYFFYGELSSGLTLRVKADRG